MEPPDVQEDQYPLKTSLNFMRQDFNLTDITLVCADGILPAHKLILCAANPYFHAILTSRSLDVDKENIKLPKVSRKVMEIILEFWYTGQTPQIPDMQNDQNLVRELASAANFLKADELFCYCFNLIAENLSSTNVQELVHLGLGHENKREICLRIIGSCLANKFCHLNQRDDFLGLKASELKLVLRHCNLTKSSMDDAMRTILSWVNFEKSREENLMALLEFLDIKGMSSDLLTAIVEECDVVRRSPVVLELLSIEIKSRAQNRLATKSYKNCTAEWLLCFSNEFGKGVVRAYDVNSDKWLPSKVLPFFLLDRTATVQYQSHIYFLGGCANETRKKMLNPFKTTGSSLIYNYCPAVNALIKSDNLLLPVCSASAGVLNGWIYVVGGWDQITDELSGRRVQRYNPVSGICEELSPTIGEYISPQVVSYKNQLYIASEIPGTVECYDTHHDQWTIVTQIACIKGDTSSTVLFSDMKLFVLVEKGHEQQFHVYDIATNHWSLRKFHHGPKDISKMWSVAKHEKVHILAEVPHRTLHLFDVESKQWEKKHHVRDSFSDYWTTIGIPAQALPHAQQTFSHTLLPFLYSFMKGSIMTDVTLVCGDKEFQAHRLVLCAASLYFSSMLSVHWEEGRNGRIDMPTVSAETMEMLLAFIYSGNIQDDGMDWKLLAEVLAAAHLMQLSGLFQRCLDSLANQLSMTCFQEVNAFAELYDHHALSSRIVTFMVRNIYQFINLDEFLQIKEHQLKRILQHPQLDWIFQEHLVTGIIKWVDFEPQTRDHHLNELLELINMDMLPIEFLNRICENSAVKRSPNANALVNLTIQTKRVKKNAFSTQNRKEGMLRLAFRNRSLKSNGQKLLCFGKDDERPVLKMFDVDANKWLPTKDIPFSISTKMAIVAYGKFVYFIGGELDEEATSLVLKYCPSTNQLVDSTCLVLAVTQAAAGVLDDAIYILGGKNAEDQWSRVVQRLTPAEESCVTVRSTLRKSKRRQEVLPFNDLLYTLGSEVVSGEASDHSTTLLKCYLECYNPVNDQWTMITHSPNVFTCLQLSVVFQGRLHLVSDIWEHELAVDLYDISSNEWSSTVIKTKSLSTVTGLWSAYKKGMPILLVADINKLHSYNIETKKWEHSLSSNKSPWNENLSVVTISPFL